ncbi:MAG: glycosyltransferase, partial [Armatimonadota bacterium]
MSVTIAYVDHAEQIGGAEKSLVELIAHLDRERFAPVILHLPGAQWLRYAQGSGARLRPGIPPSPLYAARRDELSGGVARSLRGLVGALRPVVALRRELGALRPDLVHTNSTKMHLLAGAAGRLRGLPVVWHMRDLLTQP